MLESIVPALFALVGIIIGSVMNFVFLTLANKKSAAKNSEILSYTRLTSAVSASAFAADDNERRLALKQFVTAKSEILVFAPVDIIAQLGLMERKGLWDMSIPEAQESYCKLIKIIRSQFGEKSIDTDVKDLLF